MPLLTRASADPVPVLLIVVVTVWYLRSAGALRRAGGSWSPHRTAAFLYGQIMLLFSLQSGLGAMGATDFTAAAVRDLLSAMAAPLLVVLGAPLTLLARTGRRRSVGSFVGWSGWRVAAGPFVTWALWGGSMLVLFFSGVYPHVAGGGLASLGVQVWLFVTGCLWMWTFFGAEPLPRHPGYSERLVSLLFGLAFFTVVGMALESQTTPIAPGLGLAGLHLGAGIYWIAGEGVTLVGLLGAFVEWLRADERRARERDLAEEEAAARQLAVWRATREAAAREAAAGPGV